MDDGTVDLRVRPNFRREGSIMDSVDCRHSHCPGLLVLDILWWLEILSLATEMDSLKGFTGDCNRLADRYHPRGG